MKWEPGYLFGMALQTVPEPRKIAREVLALKFPRAALWQAFALFAVLSTMQGVASIIMFPPPPALEGTLMARPLLMGAIETGILFLAVHAIYRIGRAFGGHGSFDQALLTVIWMQWVLFWVQLGVLVLSLFAPALAVMLYAFGLFLSFWIPSFFIAEQHGFTSVGLVFATILATLIAAIFLLSILLAIAGITPASLGAAPNV